VEILDDEHFSWVSVFLYYGQCHACSTTCMFSAWGGLDWYPLNTFLADGREGRPALHAIPFRHNARRLLMLMANRAPPPFPTSHQQNNSLRFFFFFLKK
jgi:hypothetical protein